VQPNAPPVQIPDIRGETFLSSLGFKTNSTTMDIGILVALYFLFMLLALAIFLLRLPRMARRKRGAASVGPAAKGSGTAP